MDVLIPFSDTGRDLIVTSDISNKIRYIAKSVEFSSIPSVTALRIAKALKKYGILATVSVRENKIVIIYDEGMVVI